VNDPVPVAKRDVTHAGEAQQPCGRDPRGAGAGDHDAQIGELARHNGRGIP